MEIGRRAGFALVELLVVIAESAEESEERQNACASSACR